MQYLTLLIDKSALQALSPREAKWMCHHFRVNVPPVFFAELIADLKKKKPATTSAEDDVRFLARKLISHAVHPSVGAQELMRSELLGHRVPLTGQIFDVNSELIDLPNGERALYVDSTPTQEIIERWQNGNFSQLEHEQASVWRDGISKIQLEKMFRSLKSLRNPNIKGAGDLIKIVDAALVGRDFSFFKGLFEIADLDQRQFDIAVQAWRRFNQPSLKRFFPYAYHILRIELYFLVGLANGVISTRDTNRIDIEYLKYLPFAHTFCSSDALHVEASQHFFMPHNFFALGTEMKSALAEIADCWDSVSEDVRKRGTASFANFPPPEMNNAVTRAYDHQMPGWRTNANKPRDPISPEENARIMAQIKPMFDMMQKQRQTRKKSEG